MSEAVVNELRQQILELREQLIAANRIAAEQREAPAPFSLRDLAAELRGGDGGSKSCKEPGTFNGDRSRVAHFCVEVRHVFESQPTKFRTERKKILYALSYMREGSAQPWANNLSLMFFDEDENDPFISWKDFETALKKAFGHADDRAYAVAEIKALVMGSKSAEEYTVRFETLERRTGWDEEALVDQYQGGLHGNLLSKIYQSPTGELPRGLAAWKDVAIKIDGLYQRLQMQKARMGQGQGQRVQPSRPSTTPAPPRAPAAPATPRPAFHTPAGNSGPGPMDLDAARRNVVCYNCNKTGHISKYCREPRRQRVRLAALSPEDREALKMEALGEMDAQKAQEQAGAAVVEREVTVEDFQRSGQ